MPLRSSPLLAACFAWLALLLTPAMAIAAEPAPLALQPLSKCLQIETDTARLMCLETAARKLLGETEKGEITVVTAQESKQARRAVFGLSLPEMQQNILNPVANGKQDEAIEMVLKSTRKGPYGKTILEMQNGQVWKQTEGKRMRIPKSGEVIVSIKRTGFGGFFAQLNGGKLTRVTRLK